MSKDVLLSNILLNSVPSANQDCLLYKRII